MPWFRARQGRPSHEEDDIWSVLGRGYTWFSVFRCIFRVFACTVDCVMMHVVTVGSNPSNTEERLSLAALTTTTLICLLCWIVKLFITYIDCCRYDDLENISECFSFITLYLGDIPKTVMHMIIAYTQTHTFHQHYPMYSVLLTCFKLIERMCGYCTKYDWRDDRWPQDFTKLYIFGIIYEAFAALLGILIANSIVVVYKDKNLH